MSTPWPRGAVPTPLLDEEAWETPDHLTDHDCLTETGAHRTRGDLDREHDND